MSAEVARVLPEAACESCGREAFVRLNDGSLWCGPCHGSALSLGYDTDLGVLVGRAAADAVEAEEARNG